MSRNANFPFCPWCGAQVPSWSRACPECGRPIARPADRTALKLTVAIAVVLAIIGVGGVVAYMSAASHPSPVAGGPTPIIVTPAPATSSPAASSSTAAAFAPATAARAQTPPSASAAGCVNAVDGDWLFTDYVRNGNGAGQSFDIHVRLSRQGQTVSGSGDLSLEGQLTGCTLNATFNQEAGPGQFAWTFAPDGQHFAGSFVAPSYGNGGDSVGTLAAAR